MEIEATWEAIIEDEALEADSVTVWPESETR
jgi:hypothetical protein